MSNNKFFTPKYSLNITQLAKILDCEYIGDGDANINALRTLEDATKGDLSFFHNTIYKQQLQNTKATACIISPDNTALCPKNVIAILAKDPYGTYAHALEIMYDTDNMEHTIYAPNSIAKTAVISSNSKVAKSCCIGEYTVIAEGATIGENVAIGPHCYIGPNVTIGDSTIIAHNVTIICATLGKNCIIHSGVRIGQDGFGFAPTKTGLKKLKQIGDVIIGDNVEIGSNTCIDRGALNSTVIGNNTKLDNLIQVGHGVRIGHNCVIAGQTGIAGSTEIGNICMIGGQVAISGHLRIGDKVSIAGGSGILKNLESGSIVGGFPALPIKKWHRLTVLLKRMLKD